jgi:hypothetical protein
MFRNTLHPRDESGGAGTFNPLLATPEITRFHDTNDHTLFTLLHPEVVTGARHNTEHNTHMNVGRVLPQRRIGVICVLGYDVWMTNPERF